jgi:Tfp pilus assembly protein PilZ
MSSEEKRIYPRTKLEWPVSCLSSGGTMKGVTANITMQGAFICCDKPLSPDETLLLTIGGPSGSMQVIAQVVWSNTGDVNHNAKPRGMGVKFIWQRLTPRIRAASQPS